MASCNRPAGPTDGGSTRSSTVSMRCCRSRTQVASDAASGVAVAIGFEHLQYAPFQDFDLQLRVLECGLAVGQQLGAALVGRQSVLQRKLAAFERADEAFKLRE